MLDRIDYSHENDQKTLEAMRGLNYILRTIRQDDRITAKYLTALKMDDPHFRAAAFEGLSYSKEEQLQVSIAYLRKDSSKEVQQAVRTVDKYYRRF